MIIGDSMTTVFCEQWIKVSENFDSERSGFTTFLPVRKGEVCIRYSENEKESKYHR